MSNIITAILNLVNTPILDLPQNAISHNRANNMGEALELYVKDLFAGTILKDEQERMQIYQDVFSYTGNQNNPPDIMLKGGDAVEVKKIESDDSSLALNSSYPKSKLYSNNPMLSKGCLECENWEEKDMIYATGVVKNERLKSLAFVYGTEYCAERDVYEKIKTVIKTGVEEIKEVEFSETRELGRVNKVDPLGITYLRVRGMWGIDNPFSVFNYIYKRDASCKFNFMCVINTEKFNSFKNKEELISLSRVNKQLIIEDKKVKNPNNPAALIDIKLISFSIKA